MSDNERKKRDVKIATREELLNRSSHSDEKRSSRRSGESSRRQTELEPVRKRTDAESTRRHSSEQPNRKAESEPIKRKRTVREDPEEKRKRKRKKKIKRIIRVTAVLGVLFLILLMLLAGLFNLFSGSKGKVRRAYAKTISSYQKRSDIAGTIFGKDVAKWMKKGDISQSFSLAVTDNTAGAAGIGISGSIDKNKSTKTAAAQLGITYNDLTPAQLKMYTDNKKIMFSSPGIYDDWLSMDCENIVSQLSGSALGADLEISSDHEFSLKMFKDEENQGEIVLSLTDEMSQVFTKEMDSLSKKAKYSRIKEKKSVMIDGQEKKLRGYRLEIKGDDFKNALVNVLSKVRTNKKIKSLLGEYAKVQYESVALYSMLFKDPNALVDEYYKEMDRVLEQINKSTFIDTGADVYIYRGVLADVDFNTVYNIDEDQMKINFVGGMNGGKRPYEDVSLVLTLDDGQQKLTASYIENTDNFDKTFVNKRNFVLGNGDNDLSVDTSLTYDKSTGVLNGSADLKTPSGGFIDLNGSGQLSKENGITKLNAQEIKLDYNDALTLVMEGSYEIKSFKKRVDTPQGNVTELFKADKAQIDQIKATVAQNFDTAINTLNKALESVDGITNVPAENTENPSETTTSETGESTESETSSDANAEDMPKDPEKDNEQVDSDAA